MAKSKKQRRIEIQDKKDARKILKVVMISTLVFLVLLYIMFRSS